MHRQILERAGGNPFFLEEIVRQLVDGGHVVREGARWRATGGVETVVIPDTVQAVLAARIDLLEPAPEARCRPPRSWAGCSGRARSRASLTAIDDGLDEAFAPLRRAT